MYKTTDVNKVSISVNSRGYFCLGERHVAGNPKQKLKYYKQQSKQ